MSSDTPPVVPHATAPAQSDGLLPVVATLLDRRRLLFGLPALFFVVTVVVAVIGPRTYTAQLAFTPTSSNSQLGSVASLAMQFGLPLPGGAAAASPSFYVDLVQSGEILRDVVMRTYDLSAGGGWQGTLVDYYELDDDREGLRVLKAVKLLRSNMTVSGNPKTAVVTVTVRAEDRELAMFLAEAVLAEINRFDLENRQSQARQERHFLEERLVEGQDSLRAAEGRLAAFLEANRDFRNSPQLQFEYDRLQRAVAMEQQIVTSLAQGYEQARIEEVRNIPVVTVVERPILPPRPDSRLLLVRGAIAIIVGFGVAVLLVVVVRFGYALRNDDPESARAVNESFQGLRRDALRPWRLFRRTPRAPTL